MKSSRLTWNQIKEFFNGEWVELTNFDWDWKKPFPTSAEVRHHASDRQSLMRQINRAGSSVDSVVLYVGVAEAVVQHDAQVATL